MRGIPQQLHRIEERVERPILGRELVDDAQPPAGQQPALFDFAEKQSIYCSSFSQTIAPGLRVGWLATRDRELYARLAAYKDYTTICAGAPSEILALMGLRERERIIARNLGINAGTNCLGPGNRANASVGRALS